MTKRGFAETEFEDRTNSAQKLMAEAGLGALLLTTEPEVRYFTGYLTRFWESPTRPWFLIVPASGKPVAVIPSIGAALMRETWINDIRTWSSPDPKDDGIGLLTDTLDELTDNEGMIGVPDGHETHIRMPQADLERLRKTIGERELTSDHGIIRKLRMIKSTDEIAKIEHACKIAGQAFARVPEIAKPGTPMEQVFPHFQMLCLEEGADWVPYLAGGAGKGGYEDVISPARNKELSNGDVLMLDTGLVWDGYFCDYDRNWSIGSSTTDTRKAHALLVEASDAAFEIARPNTTAAQLFQAMDKVLSQYSDGTNAGRLGHGIGMSLTEWPSLIPADNTILQPGMVLTLEPSTAVGDKMLVHEENIVITENEPRYLSPRIGAELPVL
ncbi:MAG: Xaa-Pro peptidase family protein [Pseudomonadota bacterium]